MSQHIQHQVDQLLLEQGEYLPLEFLLREGRLLYADYEAWRNGEMASLDEALFGDPEHIQQQLTDAEKYLQQRGWQAEIIHYKNWRSDASQALCFSENSHLNQCFHSSYRKPQDQPQLDLFSDSPATSLFNGITKSLQDRKATEARRLLEGLYDTAPDHARLGELECLVEVAESMGNAVEDVSAELSALQETLTPLAEMLLGKGSRNLLIPLWRRLSTALQGQAYLPAQSDLHLSYSASQAMDWKVVCEAVEKVPHWQTDLVLLLRHTQSCEQLRLQAEALQSWFYVCWQFPEESDELENSSDYVLRQQWKDFLDVELELPATAFPAWLLIKKPGLIHSLCAPDNEMDCPASYRTMFQLQHNNLNAQAGLEDGEAMTLRAQLKQQDPELFQHFLGKIDA
ncbi:MAG: hypothetical protein COB30_000695 [Ectothiorhodospiraceae bacterium]|nr:hypothetical protein [Ectothiorhodospiraceae bacterium]